MVYNGRGGKGSDLRMVSTRWVTWEALPTMYLWRGIRVHAPGNFRVGIGSSMELMIIRLNCENNQVGFLGHGLTMPSCSRFFLSWVGQPWCSDWGP